MKNTKFKDSKQYMFITKKEVFNCVAKALKLKQKKININSNSDNLENWDSLCQLNILSELDKKLKGKTFEVDKIANAYSSKKIIQLLKSKKLLK